MSDNTELMLILKYGSMEKAVHAWLIDDIKLLTKDEETYLSIYIQQMFPNLVIVQNKG